MCVPHPEPLSHLPPHPIPLGHPSAPAQRTQYHASNMDWWFVSHMIIYMFQCYFLRSSHPHLLPQSPKDCSIHLSLLLSHIQGYHSVQFSSVAQSCPTLCNSMNRSTPGLPVHQPTPGVHSDSHPLSHWCHPAISSSGVPFSSCPQSLPASESFPMSQLFAWGG